MEKYQRYLKKKQHHQNTKFSVGFYSDFVKNLKMEGKKYIKCQLFLGGRITNDFNFLH